MGVMVVVMVVVVVVVAGVDNSGWQGVMGWDLLFLKGSTSLGHNENMDDARTSSYIYGIMAHRPSGKTLLLMP